MNTRHSLHGAKLLRLSLGTSILVSIIATTNLSAAVLTVDDDGDSDFSTIQAAIDAASNGDEIRVFPGRYVGTGAQVIDLRGKAIRVRSVNGASQTSIDGDMLRRCIACTNNEGSNTLIEGFSIINGEGGWVDLDGDGREGGFERVAGGALLLSSSPTFTDCVFVQNGADVGGGIYASNSDGMFVRCTFFANVGFFGGAISNNDGSSPQILECSFDYNLAPRGGAIENRDGSNCQLFNCTFEGNFGIVGGCIMSTACSPTVTGCSFSHNSAESGGAIYDTGASSSLIQGCTFIANTASLVGGAIATFGSNPLMRECSFRENQADLAGGAVHADSDSLVEILDSTFLRNAAVFGGAVANRSGSHSVFDSCRFERNSAFFEGGSIDNDDSSLASLGSTSFCGSDPNDIHGTWIDLGGNRFAGSCSTIGDMDGDGQVNGSDLLVLLANWGTCDPGSRCSGDIDSSGEIDGSDLLLLLSNWST